MTGEGKIDRNNNMVKRFLNKLDGWVRNRTHRILGFLEDRLAPFTLMVLAAVLTLSIWFWDSWRGEEESVGMAIRNLVLAIAAIAALPLAIWRSKVAERQVATAQGGLLNERYQKGAEMLGSKNLPVRLGGIYALADLAREHPEDYHTKSMSLLCAFVRHPVGESIEAALPIKGLTPAAEFIHGWDEEDEAIYGVGKGRPLRVREDVQAVMTAIGERIEAQIRTEKRENYRLELSGTKLRFVQLLDADLNRTNLLDADLTSAVVVGTYLKDAYLKGANFESANLLRANLTGADLRDSRGLTQEQIDQAQADSGNPPNLTDVVDATTGKPLVWRGDPFRSDRTGIRTR